MTLIGEGIERLRPFAPVCHGVDVAALIDEATRASERLSALGAARIGDIDVETIAPRIRLTR